MIYFGYDISDERCETLRIQHFSPKQCSLEPRLYQLKWWDYRSLHPVQATFLFADCYKKAAIWSLSRRVDVEEAQSFRICGGKKFGEDSFLSLPKQQRTGMWVARQTADRFGIPYDFWCTKAMIYCEKNLWRFIPKPTQMYGSTVKEEHEHFKMPMVDYIRLAWHEKKSNEFLCANSDFYKADNYSGHQYQKDHLLFLKRQLVRLNNRAMVVFELINERRVITEGMARSLLGDKAESVFREFAKFGEEEIVIV